MRNVFCSLVVTYSTQMGMILKVPAVQMDLLTHHDSVLHDFLILIFLCLSSFNYIPCPWSLWFDLSTLVMTTNRMCMLSQLCVIFLFIYLFRHKLRYSLQREGKTTPTQEERNQACFYLIFITSTSNLTSAHKFWNQICAFYLVYRWLHFFPYIFFWMLAT